MLPDLVGTWSLVSFTALSSSGEERHPHGRSPVGLLIYTSDGHMSAVISRSNRPKFASSDLVGGTPEEIKQAFEGLEAYAGTYEVDGERATVTHHLAVCRFPNWEGGSQVRHFILTGDRLLLTTPPMTARGAEWVYTITWQRNQ
ncbi:MAG: lipocalin-like domain-containing protein [Thermoleophilia bacterium]